jgi:transketolase
VPFVKRPPQTVEAIRRGGYVLADAPGAKAAILATGSEVSLAMAAQKSLAEAGIAVRVVSMPCTSLFDRQDAAWKRSVLPKGLPRVAVEAGVTDYWRKYVGLEGAVVGIDRFGESAPAAEVYKSLGVDAAHVAAAVRSVLHG